MSSTNDLIPKIINEDIKSQKELEEAIELETENKARLLNYSSSIIQDANKEETEILININALKEKRAEIIAQPNNPELELYFRRVCSAIEKDPSILDPPLMKAFQEYRKAYQRSTSLYKIGQKYGKTKLFIYNAETEEKIVDLPWQQASFHYFNFVKGSRDCLLRLRIGKFLFSNNKFKNLKKIIVPRFHIRRITIRNQTFLSIYLCFHEMITI